MKHQTVRRFLAALVCAALLLGLAACGGGEAGAPPAPTPDASPSPETALPTESIAPAEPTETTAPAEPTETTAPAEPTESIAPAEPTDVADFPEPTDAEGGELPGDCWWLPPTDEGLADSEWSCGEDWRMEFLRGDCDPGYAGLVRILFQPREGQEYQLLYSGVWRMEDDCLSLKTVSPSGADAFEGRFPLLISPSGDDLYIQQDRDTLVCPPFFDDDMSAMGLLRIYS